MNITNSSPRPDGYTPTCTPQHKNNGETTQKNMTPHTATTASHQVKQPQGGAPSDELHDSTDGTVSRHVARIGLVGQRSRISVCGMTGGVL